MLLFLILALMLIVLTVTVVIAVALGGSAFIIVFGDVIVCIFIIVWIIRRMFRKRK
jgi:hypothetical protein